MHTGKPFDHRACIENRPSAHLHHHQHVQATNNKTDSRSIKRNVCFCAASLPQYFSKTSHLHTCHEGAHVSHAPPLKRVVLLRLPAMRATACGAVSSKAKRKEKI